MAGLADMEKNNGNNKNRKHTREILVPAEGQGKCLTGNPPGLEVMP